MARARIVLLTGPAEATPLGDILRAANPDIDVVSAFTLGTLGDALAPPVPPSRLISFCSPVIVPVDVLTGLGRPAYNFHPGPPDRPGRYPSVFALYDGNVRFGVTVHEMAARVDSGAIVAADWFDIPAGCDLGQLEELTFLRLIDAFRRLAPQMAHIDRPLPHAIYRWSGRKTTKAECDALCRLAPDLTPEEVARRRQACGAFLVDG